MTSLYISEKPPESAAGGCSHIVEKQSHLAMFEIGSEYLPLSLFISLPCPTRGEQVRRFAQTRGKAQRSAEMLRLFALAVCVPSSHADSGSPRWQAKQKVVCDMSADPHHHCLSLSPSPVVPMLTSLSPFTFCLSELLLRLHTADGCLACEHCGIPTRVIYLGGGFKNSGVFAPVVQKGVPLASPTFRKKTQRFVPFKCRIFWLYFNRNGSAIILKPRNSAGPSPRSDKTESNICKHTYLGAFDPTLSWFSNKICLDGKCSAR